jgi:hypothetical protein
MLAKLRSRLTFANVVSVIALFVALGGSGYAATKINGKNIKNKSISGKKLKNRTITRNKVKKEDAHWHRDQRQLAAGDELQSRAAPGRCSGTAGAEGGRGAQGGSRTQRL